MNEEVRTRLATALLASPDAVRGLLADWDKFDDELKEHYAAEVQWLFDKAPEIIEASEGEERALYERALAVLRTVWAS